MLFHWGSTFLFCQYERFIFVNAYTCWNKVCQKHPTPRYPIGPVFATTRKFAIKPIRFTLIH